MLLRNMYNDYLNYVLTYCSFDTYRCYEHHLSIVIDYLEINHNLIYDYDINNNHLFEFIKNQKKNNLCNSTINKRINVLKRMFKYCKSNVDLSDVSTMKESYTTFNCLTKNEIMVLLNYIKYSNLKLQNKVILSLMLSSGIRRKELVNIKLKNVNLDDNSILLTQTKTNNNRFVLFDDFTRSFLEEYMKELKQKYLFDITVHAIDSLFRRVRVACNFRVFSPHVLRHTYATILVNNDTNLEFIRITMGHTNLNTTKRYLHYNPNNLAKTYRSNFHYEITI